MSKEQLHKRLTTEQVKAILGKYQQGELKATQAALYLQVSRRRFYEVFAAFKKNPAQFSLTYRRRKPTNRIDAAIEKNILKELTIEKKLIDNPRVPVDWYNYSYVRQLLQKKYGQSVSVPTIIARAKQHGFWKGKRPKKLHDREVITNYTGELIQHDASHHLYAPDSGVPWCLTTSLDDYSRALLYADLWEHETSWNHIQAAQSLVLHYGLPYAYYVDQLRVFRYVKNRDSQWVTYTKFTDDVDPQWKQVMKDLTIEPIYALSPQAKGKIERPYRWLQDHLVRTCVREGVTRIEDAREILKQEVNDYNWKRVHSTTQEIPMRRFATARRDTTLWRKFELKPPFISVKDIFCLRTKRTVDAYRRISLKKIQLTVPQVPPRHEVELRLYPDATRNATEVRFWFKGSLVGVQRVKSAALSKLVQF